MSVNDKIYKALASYHSGTINERVYHYLGSLGLTGTISDRLAKYEVNGLVGWKALITRFIPEGAAPVFSDEIFHSGEKGGMWEPRPQYLWQDSAGTVPVTAPGDPVGRMDDLSGNGNHLTQSAGAELPTYQTDGVLHWLDFDGVDDDIAAIGTSSAFSFLHTGVDSQFSIAVLATASGNNQNLMGTANGFSNTQIGSCISISSAGGMTHAVVNGNGAVGDQARVSSKAVSSSGEALVATNAVASATLFGRVNGNEFGSSPIDVPGAGGSNTDMMIPGDPTHPVMRFYGAVVRDAVDQVIEIEQYLANLSGVSL